jgi:hypothetical protein
MNVLLLNLVLNHQFGRPTQAQAQDEKGSDKQDTANVQPATLSDQPAGE